MQSKSSTASKIESAMLLRLAERTRQLAINSHEANAANLTEGEIAAILANSANVDRLNLASLSIAPGDSRPEPVGATDLTNEINEPTRRVLLHPILSLYNDLGYVLEQRSASPELCREARSVTSFLEARHLAQLKHSGLKPEWPEFRRDWEAALAEKGYIDWKTYGPSRPRPGCSPEYVLDFTARKNGLIPSFANLDRLMIRGEVIAKGETGGAVDVEVERIYADRRAEVDRQMANWAQFVGIASTTYADTVSTPMKERGKAWFYTCKDLSAAESARVGKFCKDVTAFAKTQPSLDATVISQAAETAAIAVVGPTMEEDVIKKGLGVGAYLAEKLTKAGASKGIDVLKDKGGEMIDQAITTGMATTGVPGLLYFVGKSAAKVLFPSVAGKAEELVEGGIGKIVGWAKRTSQNLVYEESRAKETEVAAKLALNTHRASTVPVDRLVRELTPAGFRAANLLSEAYAVTQDGARAEKVIEFAASRPESDAAVELGNMVNPEVLPKHWADPVGLDLDFPGHKLERVQAARMAAAGLIESTLGVSEALSSPLNVKGSDRLTASLQNARHELEDLTAPDLAKADATTQDPTTIFERDMDNGCFRLLAEGTRAHVRPMGDTIFFSGRAVSRLLGCCEYAYERQSGVPAQNRLDTHDYSVLMQINSALWGRQISTEDLRVAIAKVEPFELKPQTVSIPVPLSEELAIANKAVGKSKSQERPGI